MYNPLVATPSKPYPSIARAIILVLLVIALQFVLALALGFFLALNQLEFQPWHYGLINCAALGIVIAWGCLESDESIRDLLPFQRVSLGLLVAMTVTLIGISVLLSEINNLIFWLLPVNSVFERFLVDMLGTREQFFGALFLLSFVAPLTEEFLFRGLMLNGFSNRYSVRSAIGVSALLFALVHLNPLQFPGAFGLGILFAWWRVHTRSLWGCLWGHALNNGLVLVIVTLGVEIPGFTTSGAPGHITFQPLWLDLLGAALTIIGLLWTAALFRKQPSPTAACSPTIPLHPPLGASSEIPGK